MNYWDKDKWIEKLRNSNDYWISFIEKEDLEVGFLYLEPDEEDIQSPHEKDEIYYILTGDGIFQIGDNCLEVQPDRVFFVPRTVEHRFYDNSVPIIAFFVLN